MKPKIKQYLADHALMFVALAVIVAFAMIGGHHEAAGMLAAGGVVLDTKVDYDALQKSIHELKERIGNSVDQALDEVKRLETLTGKTSDELTKHNTEYKKFVEDNAGALKEMAARLTDIEQKAARKASPEDEAAAMARKSPGQIVAGSDEFKAAAALPEGNRKKMDYVDVKSFHKTAIMNPSDVTTGTIYPLTAPDRQGGIVTPAQRLLTIRRLLNVVPTQSNLIEFATESTFTNNANVQGQGSSPAETEGQTLGESAMTFSLTQVGVKTIGHWIPASRQVLADAGMLAGHIDGRLTYGMKLKEETQLLLGDGTGGNISGLVTNATAYNRSASNDTRLDTLLKAMLQAALSEYAADGHVLSKVDWYSLLLLKDTLGRYIFGDPNEVNPNPQVWGLPAVPTNSMTTGEFLTGAFGIAAEIFDREQANVRVAEQHSDFAVRGLVAIIAEERIALAIYRSASLIYGTFPTT